MNYGKFKSAKASASDGSNWPWTQFNLCHDDREFPKPIKIELEVLHVWKMKSGIGSGIKSLSPGA